MCRLELFEFANHEVERLIPTHLFKLSISFDQRMEQAIGMMNLQVGGDSFRAQPAFIDRKVIPWFESNNVILLDQQVHTALHCAIRAMCRHDPVDNSVRAPTIVRGIVEMRTIRLNYLIQIFDSTH
jgi:hypothetical protein